MTKDKYYVYIIRSLKDSKYYVGYTTDLDRRLSEHNKGKSIYTKDRGTWEIITYCMFTDQNKAKCFEKYLKTHSGKAFMHKRLI